MNILLDTHTLVWFAWDMPELPEGVKDVLEDPEAINQVSIVSFWEIGIKASIGKWDLPGDVIALQSLVEAQGIEIVPITVPAIWLRGWNIITKTPSTASSRPRPLRLAPLSSAATRSLTSTASRANGDERRPELEVPVWCRMKVAPRLRNCKHQGGRHLLGRANTG